MTQPFLVNDEKRIMKIAENYPKEVLYSLMNMAGTHDTPRIKTVLGTNTDPSYMSDEEKWNFSLTGDEERLARERLMLMVFMQMTFVGVPSIYYGDEAGMEGFRDPYNRKPFPWDNMDEELLRILKYLPENRIAEPKCFGLLFDSSLMFPPLYVMII